MTLQLSYSLWPRLLVVLIIAVSLSGIMDHDLWTPDEPREAAIALSMSRSGNLVVPELAGEPFVEKPPLFYITASSLLLGLGQIIGNTAALRLTAAGFGLGTLFFTYLLGKIYFTRQQALTATAILATMIGFTCVTHWLLVDNALMFFTAASIWALAEVYERNRLFYLPLAGILTAGAFLTKGLIGPLIIACAWFGLFGSWYKKWGWKGFIANQSLVYHGVGFMAGITLALAWVAAFAIRAGPELFHEWWWTNHFGRFTGQATHLGHISPWYYYFEILPVFILPWLAPFIMALIVFLKKIIKAEPIPAGTLMLVIWALGALLLLSLSATKREIYLCILLPACALLCASEISEHPVKIEKLFYRLWLFALFIVLAAVIMAPLLGKNLLGTPLRFGWQQVLALITIIAAVLTLLSAKPPFLQRFLIVVTMCYSALLITISPIVDKYLKSYGPAFMATASVIGANPEAKIAGWNLDETTVAGFYYYCGLIFPPVADQQMLADILRGQNSRFNGVLTLTKNARITNAPAKDLPDKVNPVIFESRMGKRRLLQLLTAPNWERKGKEAEVPGRRSPRRIYPPQEE